MGREEEMERGASEGLGEGGEREPGFTFSRGKEAEEGEGEGEGASTCLSSNNPK
jgi:hypothetical protein